MVAKKTAIKGKSVETAPSKTTVKTVKKVPSKKSTPPSGKTAQPNAAAKMVKPATKKEAVKTAVKKRALGQFTGKDVDYTVNAPILLRFSINTAIVM